MQYTNVAINMDFTDTNFSVSEFPEHRIEGNVLEHMDESIIRCLIDVRRESGRRMYPSPIYGAHVRATGGSRHSLEHDGKPRLADATDFFVAWEDAAVVWDAIQRHPEIGGKGIYTDHSFKGETGDYCMFHIDNRKGDLTWVAWRETRHHPIKYVYKQNNPSEYLSVLEKRAKW